MFFFKLHNVFVGFFFILLSAQVYPSKTTADIASLVFIPNIVESNIPNEKPFYFLCEVMACKYKYEEKNYLLNLNGWGSDDSKANNSDFSLSNKLSGFNNKTFDDLGFKLNRSIKSGA